MSRKGGGIFVKKHNSHRGVVMEVNESISNFFIIYKRDAIFRDREGTLYFVFYANKNADDTEFSEGVAIVGILFLK